MARHNDIGKAGENYAETYLRSKRYRIIERNFRRPWGELDLITHSPDGTLVFVEVKTMGLPPAGHIIPEDNMTRNKTSKTRRAALYYANANPKLSPIGWRIDLIAIELRANERPIDIRHYENI